MKKLIFRPLLQPYGILIVVVLAHALFWKFPSVALGIASTVGTLLLLFVSSAVCALTDTRLKRVGLHEQNPFRREFMVFLVMLICFLSSIMMQDQLAKDAAFSGSYQVSVLIIVVGIMIGGYCFGRRGAKYFLKKI